MRIRTYLGIMTVVIFLPILFAAAMALEKIRLEERDAAIRGLKETALRVSLIVDRELRGSLSALQVLGNSEYLETGNFKSFYAQAAALTRPDVWLVLLDATGTQIVNTLVPFGTPTLAPVALPIVSKVIANQKSFITDLVVGAVTGKMQTSIYVPTKADGGKSYVVAQAFGVDHWKKTSINAQMPDDWIVAVIDSAGKFIARSHKTEQLLGQPARPELVAAAAAAENGVINHSTVEGVKSYDAFTHSELSGWTVAVAAPAASIEAASVRAVQLAAVGMLLAVFAALAVALAFGRRLTTAINVASTAAGMLGRGGKPPVARSSIVELDLLNHALSGASDLLDLERASRKAAETDRQRLLQKETEARKTAEAQNVAKDHFLAMLGHELRNPLAAITGATTILKLGTEDKVRNDRCVAIIDRQNRHLNYIVDDLLDVSRLLMGKIVLNAHPLDLAESIKRCIEGIRSTERANGFNLAFNGNSVWVNADQVRVEQILNNLINNAIKFSQSGSAVRVGLHEAAGRAVITVQDEGAGVSEDLLPHIFEPFVQGPPAANRVHAGLGIGLALVKQLVALHGGDVQAASKGLGSGSLFTISLPSIPAPAPVGSGARPVPAPVMRKLVYVEDNADAREVMSALLRTFGYEVVEVALGAAALPAVTASQPDAVVVDIGLPDIDGYEVARRIRANLSTHATTIIALTGYGQLPDNHAALQAGFDAYLVKPVDIFDLTKKIEEILAKTHPPAN